SGSSIEGGVVLAPGLHGFLGTFPGTGGVDVRIERDEIVELEPGSYGLLDVRGGGQLILRDGNYMFDSVQTHHQSYVTYDSVFGAVVIHVAGPVSWGANAETSAAGFALMHYGTGEILVEAPFVGTLISPAGGVSLRTPGSPY